MGGAVQTITEQVYHTIRAGILSRHWAAGDRLTAKALQDMLGVSSTPIREALTRLQRDGLIEYQPNIGMRVVALSEKDRKEIFDLMVEFDLIAMRFACRSSERDEMLRELTTLQEEAAQCLREGRSDRWEELSDRFHLVFYQYADNTRLSGTLDRIRLQFSLLSNAYQQIPENQAEIQREHDEVLNCLTGGDDAAAEQALREHLASSLKKAAEVYERE